MQIVSLGDNLHEMTKPILWENKKNIINLSSAESTQRVVKIKITIMTNNKAVIKVRSTYRFIILKTGISFMVFLLAASTGKVFTFFLITRLQIWELQREKTLYMNSTILSKLQAWKVEKDSSIWTI